ncbi:transporter substrate-binding domain-containing protein [uncultured Paraglaciecola sp.]|uniref:substrate-binding periplasmic protein n=1 Tax=uncultured Paraglaciecola sp. TaxID=1765024 RepID=UPI0030D74FC9
MASDTKLQVVTELSPPYQTLMQNEVSGTATEIVKSLLSESGLTPTINMYPWARAYEKAISEPNTLIYSIAKSDKRNKLFHWLLPVAHYKLGLVALSARQDLHHTPLKELENFSLAVQRNDISHQWAIENGLEEGKQLIICSDIGCSWKLLVNKKVDFIVESPELIAGMLAQYKLPTNAAKYVTAIPELAITGYLAANINIENSILEKLQSAIKSHSH